MRRVLGRRAFLVQGTTLVLATGQCVFGRDASAPDSKLLARIALMTDLHYADKPSAGNRYYRESIPKLEEALAYFQGKQPNFVVELGDLIDAADSPEVEQKYLRTINEKFRNISPRRHYVLGNHCVDTLTKAEFLGEVGQEQSYYSFDHQGWHFIILDACFRTDGMPYGRKNSIWTDANIPEAELDWLREDLKASSRPTIVFAHQRLDVSNHYGVKNCEKVRAILEASEKVEVVFQGHSHKNDYRSIAGIHYCTLAAMVEGSGKEHNAYGLVEIYESGEMVLQGERKQSDYRWS